MVGAGVGAVAYAATRGVTVGIATLEQIVSRRFQNTIYRAHGTSCLERRNLHRVDGYEAGGETNNGADNGMHYSNYFKWRFERM